MKARELCLWSGSMTHTDTRPNHVTAAWWLTERSVSGLARAAVGVVRSILRGCGIAGDPPEQRMSREWLEEFERRATRHHDTRSL
jgi:hypothetical protein